MTLRAVHEDCASRFLAEKAWEKGLRWWEWHRPALTDPEWVEVHVRIPAHLADKLVGDTRLEFQDTRFGDLQILPGHQHVHLVEKQGLKSGQEAMSRLLNIDFDVVVIDTPPAAGVQQLAPLYLGGLLVAPVEPDLLALQGLTSLLKVWREIALQVDLGLSLVINKRVLNSTNQQMVVDAITESGFGQHVLPVHLTNRQIVSNAMKQGMPVWKLDPKDAAAAKWALACKMILETDRVPTEETVKEE